MTEVEDGPRSPATDRPAGPAAADIHHIDSETCRRFQAAVELVGKRWSAGILLAAARGAERFVEYRNLVEGISERLLAARLKELEREQLLRREVIPSTPVQIRYTLTERGRELLEGLSPLIRWDQRWQPRHWDAPDR